MERYIDIPKVWLLAALILAWLQKTFVGFGLSFGPVWADLVGGLLVGGGLVLMALAAYELRRHRTTVMPHETASALVTSGIYSRSRNPIYVADSLILTGMILFWDAVLSLPLVPIFVWVMETRFIIPEENRLRRNFRADYARYEKQTRRWL
ncbi:isoprenylcysteine carboxylmethyltransferase family protein [Marivita sp. GX14005]|uniref:methyltransferase family protein n=1 Tax=Marivita sp. GX14005 TaxID=2942276 RepID=UPI00201954D6|nr:isoprenylcysteine carboxylmethyltransferase family protein [Marivita sp. GX14005]MCL3882402.1 isoprenylcysteine carboxylmethyltransferase family protein [Marivita sp. GX14005]